MTESKREQPPSRACRRGRQTANTLQRKDNRQARRVRVVWWQRRGFSALVPRSSAATMDSSMSTKSWLAGLHTKLVSRCYTFRALSPSHSCVAPDGEGQLIVCCCCDCLSDRVTCGGDGWRAPLQHPYSRAAVPQGVRLRGLDTQARHPASRFADELSASVTHRSILVLVSSA